MSLYSGAGYINSAVLAGLIHFDQPPPCRRAAAHAAMSVG